MILGVGAVVGLVSAIIFESNTEEECSKKDCPKKEIVKSESMDSQISSIQKGADVVSDIILNAAGQADAVMVDSINADRIYQLMKRLAVIDHNQTGAEEEIKKLKAAIQQLLTSNRGGVKGAHGFIGEVCQVYISNIKAFIAGDEPLYILLDDNSMTDYIRGMQLIQQKACQAGGHLGLDAIKRHIEKYPEFLKQGGIYQIPKDMFKKYELLKNLPKEAAMKLRKDDLRLWKYIQAFTKENPNAVIEPMEVSYSDIQTWNIKDTVKKTEENTDKEFERQREEAHEKYGPSVKEFGKVCLISAAIEGVVSAGTEFIQKLKSGKQLSEFTKQDIKDILEKCAIGSGKGTVRGALTYIATNILKFPAAVVSGLVTAVFGITQEGYLYFKQKISKHQFMKNTLFVSFETAASTAGAVFGKHLFKKHPVIGALFGSICGSAGVSYVQRTAFA